MNIKTLAWGGLAAAAVGFLGLGETAAAQNFPDKAIRIIVPTAPGGTLDLTTRLFAEKMGEDLGQAIVVENRPGGDTIPGSVVVKNSPADGYTLLSQAPGLLLVPQLRFDPPWDPLTDFTGVGMMAEFPWILVIGNDQPDQTTADLVARAKANPGGLTFASAGVGSPPHIAAARFLLAAGVEMLHAPYKGNGAALPDVVAGRVDMIMDGYVSSASYLDGKRLRALAVTSPNRIEPLPDVPTLEEQGIDFSTLSWLALVAPAGTPPEVVDRLNEAMQHAAADPDLAARLRADGSEPATYTAAEFNQLLADQYGELTGVIDTLHLEKQ
ncbi:MAG: tripartite tricarboxylate transporter substrate binding protein [Amaricoccus sp.]